MAKLLCRDKVTGKMYLKDVSLWNVPVLGRGMYPVNWNGNDWERTTVDKWDYNYESVAETKSNGTVEGNGKGKWANAMTEDGSIYVWIPRYSYKIVSGYHKAVKSWNSDLVDGTEKELGKIEVKFSDGVKDDASNGFILHPAFTFGKDELTGFWAMKFTASRIDADCGYNGSRDVPSSRPSVRIWSNISIGGVFCYSYNLNRELDSHLMKNTEWGAVAYLTNAIGRIPYINNCEFGITGTSGGSQDSSYKENYYLWNTKKGVKASTTHNVYGVYDMSGGAWEYVSGYYGRHSFINSEEKYKDVYSDKYSDKIYGDGVYETSSGVGWDGYAWDSNYMYPFRGYAPLFIRGGCCLDGSGAGIFSLDHDCVISDVSNGFRVTLAIKKN